MDVITEKPRPVVPHCGACCGASGPGQGAHAQYRPARSEAVTWPTGLGSSTRRRWQGPARLRDRSLRAVRLACGDHAGRPPPTDAAHGRIKQPSPTAGSNNTRNTSGPLPPPTDTAHRCRPRAHQAARPHSRIQQHLEHQLHPEHQRPATTTHRHRPQMPPTGASSSPAPQTRATRHAPPDTRHQARAQKHTTHHTLHGHTKRAGTPRFRPALDTQRLSAPRARWHHATGAHQCATAVSCQ